MRSTIRGTHRLAGTIFFLFILVFSVGAQNNPQPQFDRANDHLQSGNYPEALSIYKTLENQNNVSGSLYLNMAISYVQLDSLGKAKYYFLMAEDFEETRERAENGLKFVESQFSRQSAVLPKLPWQRFFAWLGESMGAVAVLATGIIGLNIGILLFLAGWFYQQIERYSRIGGISMGVVGLLIILSSFYVQHLQNRYSQAIMVHQQTNVLEQPESDASVVSQAYEGYSFTVDHSRSQEHEGWSYVRMSNGLYGWIENSEIMVL